MSVVGWRLAVGGWRLAVGGWRLAVGGWRLAVGGWRLAGPSMPVAGRRIASIANGGCHGVGVGRQHRRMPRRTHAVEHAPASASPIGSIAQADLACRCTQSA
ncbi:annexin Max4 [Burkholderia pseudomallei MSHR6137]|nr:annexin Max4 [Burkholderia pseudomallei MSHR6137]